MGREQCTRHGKGSDVIRYNRFGDCCHSPIHLGGRFEMTAGEGCWFHAGSTIETKRMGKKSNM